MEIGYSREFKRQLKRLSKRYRQIKKDIEPIIEALILGETPGDQITGVDYTLYKVRAKNTDAQRGKSGGYRVIYYLKTTTSRTLMTVYSKSEYDDVPADALERLVNEIKQELES
jgi:mRNA-degrading endonuclease RelE of RelBE toxin-antitoxin system